MTDLVSATDAMLGSLRTQWLADTPAIVSGPAPEIVYEPLEPDLKQHPRQSAKPWVRIAIRHAAGSKVTLNNDKGTARYRNTGTIWIQVFTPTKGDASQYMIAQQLAMVAATAYEGKRAGPSGDVVYTSVNTQEKPLDGAFIHIDVKVAFYWDGIR